MNGVRARTPQLTVTLATHKKGDSHTVTNYRPICLCNTLAKVIVGKSKLK